MGLHTARLRQGPRLGECSRYVCDARAEGTGATDKPLERGTDSRLTVLSMPLEHGEKLKIFPGVRMLKSAALEDRSVRLYPKSEWRKGLGWSAGGAVRAGTGPRV